ncbi:hypothetical protein LEN26_016980 [Aphanomyces euteiches]|uniref:Uncharacterized protein n=1 Tax=Aphanomyces euteiches TaxID=100861 RepID=A0A6G0WWK1_9STRA|nr:hypothetical protein Ae201684_010883 [Aphanomyces euteiches]KAH9097450.1 hypothetical protein LEN26_016980 [Aphanomyces euteiches]KAH9132199.1 hypothetical protein AeRB84_021325 [Aphanomyces euteiches]
MREEGLTPASMAFYGEVFFTSIGLKSAVVLTGIPLDLQTSFVHGVVEASGVLELNILSLVTIGQVSTSAFDFTGHLALVNNQHPLARRVIETFSTRMPLQVSERLLAQFLDYPISLDECTEADGMMEVGYFDALSNKLVTSYCAMNTPSHRQLVNKHFRGYTEKLTPVMKLRVEATLI